jgi:predicted NUDIX family NTP pyrophosphohydrolase
MAKTSAGILPYRVNEGRLEVFLVHPGGPFWARKDHGAWSIAKGEFEPPEDAVDAARREFNEETGFDVTGDMIELEPRRQASGKIIHVWAVEGDYDPAQLRSGTFTIEWPKGSGRRATFPEVDRAAWFDLADAHERILAGQAPFLDDLAARVR